jgi:hypothetical protein
MACPPSPSKSHRIAYQGYVTSVGFCLMYVPNEELGLYRYGFIHVHDAPYPAVSWARRMLRHVLCLARGSHNPLVWDWLENRAEHKALADALRDGKEFSMELRAHEIAARFEARPVLVLRLFQPCACQGLCAFNV